MVRSRQLSKWWCWSWNKSTSLNACWLSSLSPASSANSRCWAFILLLINALRDCVFTVWIRANRVNCSTINSHFYTILHTIWSCLSAWNLGRFQKKTDNFAFWSYNKLCCLTMTLYCSMRHMFDVIQLWCHQAIKYVYYRVFIPISNCTKSIKIDQEMPEL